VLNVKFVQIHNGILVQYVMDFMVSSLKPEIWQTFATVLFPRLTIFRETMTKVFLATSEYGSCI